MNTGKIESFFSLTHFALFPEYFIALSIVYLLIVLTIMAYNVYGLLLQKVTCEIIVLVLFMSCYLLFNDDLLFFSYMSFNNSIIIDYFGFFCRFVVCFSSALYFLIISDFLKKYKLVSFEYLIITLFSVLGLLFLCSSNDFMIAYLSIELSSLAMYLIATFKKTSIYSVESGLKYFVTGTVSSSFFLLGSSFIYSQMGTINFTAIERATNMWNLDKLPIDSINWHEDTNPYWIADFVYYLWQLENLENFEVYSNSLVDLGFSLILFSLLIKLGAAPFHFWSLDVYEGSPTISTFFFATISKFSIFVLLIRLFFVSFASFKVTWTFYSILIAGLSVFIGSLGGLHTKKLKTLLSYSSTTQMGYAIFILNSSDKCFAFEKLFFFLIIYIITNLCIWFIVLSLVLKTNYNKYSKELGDLALLSKSNPAIAIAFTLTLFSLAGLPPLIGFLAKISIFSSLLESVDNLYLDFIFLKAIWSFCNEFYLILVLIALCSVISTFYYARIVKVLYFENVLVGKLYHPITHTKTALLSLLIFSLIFLFLNPNFLILLLRFVSICFLYV